MWVGVWHIIKTKDQLIVTWTCSPKCFVIFELYFESSSNEPDFIVYSKAYKANFPQMSVFSQGWLNFQTNLNVTENFIISPEISQNVRTFNNNELGSSDPAKITFNEWGGLFECKYNCCFSWSIDHSVLTSTRIVFPSSFIKSGNLQLSI